MEPRSAHMQQTSPNWLGLLLSWHGGCFRCFITLLSFTTFFFYLLLSVEVCTGQCLLLSVVLHRSPSAFALSLQIRLGS